MPSALDPVRITLEYTPPLDWNFILTYLGARITPGIDLVDGERYVRAIVAEGDAGMVFVTDDPSRNQLVATIFGDARRRTPEIGDVLRRMFDLDCNPAAIQAALGSDPWIKPLVEQWPGIRVPGAWSAFELLARTIVNQQISVKAANTIMRRITERHGREIGGRMGGAPARIFPSAATLAEVNLDGFGMGAGRAAVLQNAARKIATGAIPLGDPDADSEDLKNGLLALLGIGRWTVEYFALRALRDPDAWPESDLVLRRSVERHPLSRSAHESWRPYRGYAAMYLWREGRVQAAA